MKALLTSLILASSLTAFAKPEARALIVRGDVTFGGKPVKTNSLLRGSGEFSVGDKSYLKLLLDESNHVMVIGANSKAQINFNLPPEKSEMNLLQGIGRWVTGAENKGAGIKTKNAVMGIRGTDFLATYNPLLGESEIICFDGKVEFSNLGKSGDAKMIEKNQWGGVGGRFGGSIGGILDLPEDVISHFNGAIPLN